MFPLPLFFKGTKWKRSDFVLLKAFTPFFVRIQFILTTLIYIFQRGVGCVHESVSVNTPATQTKK